MKHPLARRGENLVQYAPVAPKREAARSLKTDRLEDKEDVCVRGPGRITQVFFSESLILAENERWQRGLGMQVGRDRLDSNIRA